MHERDEFRTFCHIGEYDEFGYQILHRLLAMSQPLALWAPTSPQLQNERCLIPPRQFLGYVEKGYIRVFAREQWLTSKEFRDNHPFPGARWDAHFDGALRKICEDDASLPVRERRVVAAPLETGWEWAEEYLAANPAQVTRLNRIARSKTAASKVPAGTLQAAFKFADGDPFRLAQAIFRDAYNHGQAVAFSGAEVPLLLSPADPQFLDVLGETAGPQNPAASSTRGKRGSTSSASPPASPSLDQTGSELAAQLLEVLRLLDIGAPGIHRPNDLDRFVNGEGHRELVRWLSNLCEHLKQVDARNLDNAVINALRADLGNAKLAKPVREAITHKATSLVGAVGLLAAVVAFATDPGSAWPIAGITAGACTVIAGVLRQIGYVPASFTGSQWPFLYTYDSEATKRNLTRLLNILREG